MTRPHWLHHHHGKIIVITITMDGGDAVGGESKTDWGIAQHNDSKERRSLRGHSFYYMLCNAGALGELLIRWGIGARSLSLLLADNYCARSPPPPESKRILQNRRAESGGYWFSKGARPIWQHPLFWWRVGNWISTCRTALSLARTLVGKGWRHRASKVRVPHWVCLPEVVRCVSQTELQKRRGRVEAKGIKTLCVFVQIINLNKR